MLIYNRNVMKNNFPSRFIFNRIMTEWRIPEISRPFILSYINCESCGILFFNRAQINTGTIKRHIKLWPFKKWTDERFIYFS
jgi:hypothetical protein